MISAAPKHQKLAGGYIIGTRFHSAPVIRIADTKRIELGHIIKADFRWRIFVFSGRETSKTIALGEFLSASATSPIVQLAQPDLDIDSVIDIRVVFQEVEDTCLFEQMPQVFFPNKGVYGLRDYEKIFCSDNTLNQDNQYDDHTNQDDHNDADTNQEDHTNHDDDECTDDGQDDLQGS